ncbi:MAG: anhydro-N-acetylmuramic acid kinase [Elusimicrobia bacterium]|nr:anhydro-N-acetylmuramic acid kinase [Elusimicrobiota bacterium]
MASQPALALGLMSGTSADGITAAIIEIKKPPPKNLPVRCLAHKTYPYPKKIRRRVLNAIDLKTPEISRLNFELGYLFARAATDLIQCFKRKNPKSQIEVIGSHGQTIYYGPDDHPKNCLQISEGAMITQKTGLPVVFNFRPRDIVAGGQGAPLTPFFDWYCFKHLSPIILLNIGGIANVTLVNKKPSAITAFDTGPGNCLLDLTMAKISAGKIAWDQNGQRAAQGTIDRLSISQAVKRPYFHQRPPKATGRELFNAQFISHHFGRIKKSKNLLATLTAFTAETISLGIKKFILPQLATRDSRVATVLVSGGGTNNAFLMKLLEKTLKPAQLALCDKVGIPSEAKEAAAFALFAHLALHKKPNHLPSATGAKGQPRILGQIIWS